MTEKAKNKYNELLKREASITKTNDADLESIFNNFLYADVYNHGTLDPKLRELVTLAFQAGGVAAHRLGLSETVLIFKQHLEFIGGLEMIEKVIKSRIIFKFNDMDSSSLISSILSRSSLRRFTSEPVSDEAVQTLLHAAMAAPSSMNLQPWHFIVIRDEKLKLELRSCLPYAKMLKDGSIGIVVCGDTSLYERVNRMDGEDNTLYWVQDCSAASENLLLAAHALGLGAVWTGVYPLESRVSKLQELLRIPSSIVPLNLIVVGHPASSAKPMDKWDATKIHYEHF